MSSPSDRRARLRRWTRRGLRFLERTFAAIGVITVTYLVWFNVSVVSSGSMSPTLRGTSTADGDWVLTEKLTYRLRRPRRWEVVTFVTPDGDQRMKRVIALPGESVRSVKNWIAVDGGELRRPEGLDFLSYYGFGNLLNGRTFDCDDGYYVMGDDSRDSLDSRFEGTVPRSQVIGRAWLRVWPPSRWGRVE